MKKSRRGYGIKCPGGEIEMDKFWEWMAEKKLGFIGFNNTKEYLRVENKIFKPTRQMLIGYMIEYLIEKKAVFYLNHWYQRNGIERAFHYLRRKINRLPK
jgi:hypothetical protein